MKRPSDRGLLELAIKTWGQLDQLRQTIEELNELAVALSHYCRQGYDSRAEVIGELSDVELMLEQVKMMLEISTPELRDVKTMKLDRLWLRLEKAIGERNG